MLYHYISVYSMIAAIGKGREGGAPRPLPPLKWLTQAGCRPVGRLRGRVSRSSRSTRISGDGAVDHAGEPQTPVVGGPVPFRGASGETDGLCRPSGRQRAPGALLLLCPVVMPSSLPRERPLGHLPAPGEWGHWPSSPGAGRADLVGSGYQGVARWVERGSVHRRCSPARRPRALGQGTGGLPLRSGHQWSAPAPSQVSAPRARSGALGPRRSPRPIGPASGSTWTRRLRDVGDPVRSLLSRNSPITFRNPTQGLFGCVDAVSSPCRSSQSGVGMLPQLVDPSSGIPPSGYTHRRPECWIPLV